MGGSALLCICYSHSLCFLINKIILLLLLQNKNKNNVMYLTVDADGGEVAGDVAGVVGGEVAGVGGGEVPSISSLNEVMEAYFVSENIYLCF
jgi:hypothetical protein